MKTITIALLLFLLCPAFAVAGEIYGSITEGEKSIGPGVKVDIVFEGKTLSAETDKNGSYRLYIQGQGKCTLTVHYKQQSPSIEISSYEGSVRYDLILEMKDGRYSLRRK